MKKHIQICTFDKSGNLMMQHRVPISSNNNTLIETPILCDRLVNEDALALQELQRILANLNHLQNTYSQATLQFEINEQHHSFIV